MKKIQQLSTHSLSIVMIVTLIIALLSILSPYAVTVDMKLGIEGVHLRIVKPFIPPPSAGQHK